MALFLVSLLGLALGGYLIVSGTTEQQVTGGTFHSPRRAKRWQRRVKVEHPQDYRVVLGMNDLDC